MENEYLELLLPHFPIYYEAAFAGAREAVWLRELLFCDSVMLS